MFYLNSSFSTILIIILLIVPLINIKSRNIKIIVSFLIVFIPIVIVMILEKTENIKKVNTHYIKLMQIIVNFNHNYLNIYKYNVLKIIQYIVHGEHFNEFAIIKNVLDFLIKFEY